MQRKAVSKGFDAGGAHQTLEMRLIAALATDGRSTLIRRADAPHRSSDWS